MIADQVLFTATDEDRANGLKGGYAVAAKSSGITDDILRFLSSYHTPYGAHDHDIFKKDRYKSLTTFKSKVIYTTAYTGIGHDGRDGTYTTRHFVFEKDEFKKIYNDTRNLDFYSLRIGHQTRHLPLVSISGLLGEEPHLIGSDSIDVEKVLDSLRKGRKVALIHKNPQLVHIQKFIASLDIEDRIIPFSNAVFEYRSHTNFQFIVANRQLQHTLNDKGWDTFTLLTH